MKENTAFICETATLLQRHYDKQKKPGTKDAILCDFICMKFFWKATYKPRDQFSGFQGPLHEETDWI